MARLEGVETFQERHTRVATPVSAVDTGTHKCILPFAVITNEKKYTGCSSNSS
jgi:hypothetical protein